MECHAGFAVVVTIQRHLEVKSVMAPGMVTLCFRAKEGYLDRVDFPMTILVVDFGLLRFGTAFDP